MDTAIQKCGIGIDISKGHCTVSAYAGQNKLKGPRVKNYRHTKSELADLVSNIKKLDYNVRIVMEDTGVYSLPVIQYLSENNIFVSVVNPVVIKKFNDNKIHEIKTDKVDSIKIARYAYMYFDELEEFSPEDEIRYKLKLLNRARENSLKQQTMNKNSLISLLDKTFPGIEKLFNSPIRSDGHQKWVDFVTTFWHADLISRSKFETFLNRYKNWCEKYGYHFSTVKAAEIYELACESVPSLKRDEVTKDLVSFHIRRLNNSLKETTKALDKMNDVAQLLPEYQVVLDMDGVGRTLAPQIIAEIGDIRRFPNRRAIVAFAGIDPGSNQSGDYNQVSNSTSHAGTAYLRKSLFLLMKIILQKKPDNDIYRFIMKKKEEGKPYRVYMIAGCNKFLRQYYGTLRKFFNEQ